ncbi:MAG: poly-gamma-glutamate hydrolase family protein, partial [Acidimicrobiales bacterium]
MGRFAELLAHEGVEEDLVLRSTFGFMAFHGGNLEEGTDLVAAAAAEQAGASLYAVRQPPDLRWHLPSIEVGPDESPALATFL